ncbi:formylmethanofuran dehydrogenase subunit A [Candidatus Bathyarchaeota archaeon]|nr:formylmethanofuran dehydrogenase subunit A [Candidatus Bathyarchaeota archaeon]
MKLLIRNGFVFDPQNGIDGEKMDIAIQDGRIVESVNPSEAVTIDASNMIVMPGGVDLHSHIAGAKVNAGRLLRPEDHYKDVEIKTSITRSGVGHSIPSTFTTGYRYARMGYTTVFEPATAPLKTLHTHEELNDIPILDKACFPLFGNNWIVMEYLKENRVEECAAYIAWMLNAVKGYAIKIVNPGGVEAWGWGKGIKSLDDQVPYFEITPREIIRGLCKVNKLLNLPHPIHVHCNNLGKPGNYRTTIETMDCISDLATDDKPIIHVTHVQFTGYGGVDWASLASGADKIAKYVNAHRHVTLDLGQIIFTDTTTMTADGPFQYQLYLLTGNKWINSDVEAETGAGVVPMRYRRNNYVHAVMWAIGLELALLVKDPWRVFMTTDHPNGGPFTAYPRVISWLMSREVRRKILAKVPRLARVRTNLSAIDREYTFYEIAIVTRAGTAKILGLKNKGHLGIGADADIAIYNINPNEVDPSKDYKKVRRAFRNAAYTIKDGEIIAKDGEIIKVPNGRTYWSKPEVRADLMDAMKAILVKKFEDYYTVKLENYYIPERCLVQSNPINVKASL